MSGRRGIPTIDELYGDTFREYMTKNAPDCPTCGAHALVALRMPEVDRFAGTDPNGDRVTVALEVYHCSACGARAANRVELDRVTQVEQDAENDKAIKRAELRRERPVFVGSRAWDREVLRQYPRRPEPDLMQRWQERRASAKENT